MRKATFSQSNANICELRKVNSLELLANQSKAFQIDHRIWLYQGQAFHPRFSIAQQLVDCFVFDFFLYLTLPIPPDSLPIRHSST